MSGFDYPGSSPLAGPDGLPSPGWANIFSRWHSIILSVQESGTTAQRPTRLLWIGRRYFDVTLGKPVYLKTATPRVWVDAAGVAV